MGQSRRYIRWYRTIMIMMVRPQKARRPGDPGWPTPAAQARRCSEFSRQIHVRILRIAIS